MPKIPVNINSMATELAPLDENIPYHGIVRSCEISEKEDKNGNVYLTDVRIEITDPEEFKGRAAFCNYMPIVGGRINSELEVLFPRFVKAFKVPFDSEGLDPSDAIGCEGDFTIRMEEYQGRKTPRIQDFLL